MFERGERVRVALVDQPDLAFDAAGSITNFDQGRQLASVELDQLDEDGNKVVLLPASRILPEGTSRVLRKRT